MTSSPAPPVPTPITPTPAPTPDVVKPTAQEDLQAGKVELEKIKTELKIKIANVNKTLLDLEMDNITGDLDDATYANKVGRLEAVKKKLEKQILEL